MPDARGRERAAFRTLAVMTPSLRPFPSSAASTLAILLLLVTAAPASADATLLGASPADGSIVEGSPESIVAIFDQALADDGSSIILRGPDDEEVAAGGVDPDEPTSLIIDDVPELAPGEYQVRWVAASTDGHLIRDTWTFTVTAAPSATPAPTEIPSDPPSDSPAPTEASPPPSPRPSASAAPVEPADPASSTSDSLIPIVVLLAVVGIGGAYFLRRRRPTV
jgi:methionine-rich copper-binding protein CopC